jgi:hypothetical protein
MNDVWHRAISIEMKMLSSKNFILISPNILQRYFGLTSKDWSGTI